LIAARHRTRAALAAAGYLLLAAPLAAPLAAQTRVEQSHDFDTAEGRLLGFYSASLLFTPVGIVAPASMGRVEVGLELGFVPQLDAEQRAIGSDKPENTNLAPVFPRPRVAASLPGGVLLEASWLPPVKVFGVKANLLNAAVSAPLGAVAGVGLRGRVTAPFGRVEGAITCSGDVAEDGDADLQLYYAVICNGRDSEDRFEPRHVAAELVATSARARSVGGGTWTPWAALGLRREWTRFDVGVMREDGSREPDHPILRLRGAYAHGSLGAAWSGPRGMSLAGEVLYAPGSLVTARLYAGVRR
jgi:hypothetical protein